MVLTMSIVVLFKLHETKFHAIKCGIEKTEPVSEEPKANFSKNGTNMVGRNVCRFDIRESVIEKFLVL